MSKHADLVYECITSYICITLRCPKQDVLRTLPMLVLLSESRAFILIDSLKYIRFLLFYIFLLSAVILSAILDTKQSSIFQI